MLKVGCHGGVLTDARGSRLDHQPSAFPPALKRIGSQRAALAPPENGFLELIGCQAQSIRCPQEHVSMTNLRGRVRAFPHSLPLRERTTVMCRCGQIRYILVKRQYKASGHWQCSELLIWGVFHFLYLLSIVMFSLLLCSPFWNQNQFMTWEAPLAVCSSLHRYKSLEYHINAHIYQKKQKKSLWTLQVRFRQRADFPKRRILDSYM